jgi:hypothetical protein
MPPHGQNNTHTAPSPKPWCVRCEISSKHTQKPAHTWSWEDISQNRMEEVCRDEAMSKTDIEHRLKRCYHSAVTCLQNHHSQSTSSPRDAQARNNTRMPQHHEREFHITVIWSEVFKNYHNFSAKIRQALN